MALNFSVFVARLETRLLNPVKSLLAKDSRTYLSVPFRLRFLFRLGIQFVFHNGGSVTGVVSQER